MRVRVIRWTDPTSSVVQLAVQRWCVGQWEPVRDFPLNESTQAGDFAMRLSMSKRVPVEMVVFEDGEKVERGLPLILGSENGQKLSETSP